MTISYKEHASYLAMKHRYEKMEITSQGSMLENAQYILVPPVGMFQESLVTDPAVTAAAQYITNVVAKGSEWTDAAKIFAFEGHDPELIRQTKSGFSSMISQHDPVMELPSSIDYLINKATKDSKSLPELYVDTVDDVLTFGRAPLILDVTDDNKIAFVKYNAINMPGWGATSVGTDDAEFSYLILIDFELNPNFNPIEVNAEDEYLKVVNYHHINENGQYAVTKYYEKEGIKEREETIVPTLRGKALDFIPAIAIGSLDNTPDADVIPLEGISNCSIKIFTLTAVLSHAERSSSIPTFVMSGVDADETPSMLGANVCLPMADAQARAYYTTTDTSAMTQIQNRINDFYSYAQELGASLLGSRKGTSESGEALRLRQASSTASLKSVVDNVGKGITKLCEMADKWSGGNGENVKFEPNKEFSTFALTANETVALVQTWQAGGIAHSTLLENFRKAGMLKSGETVDDELANLKKPDEKYIDPAAVANAAAKVGSTGETGGLDVGENLPKSNTLNKNL